MGGVIQTFGVVHESSAPGVCLFSLAPEGAQGSRTPALGARMSKEEWDESGCWICVGSAQLVAVEKQGKWMWLSTEMSRALPGFIAVDLAAHGLSVLVILTDLQFNYCICKTGAQTFRAMAASQGRESQKHRMVWVRRDLPWAGTPSAIPDCSKPWTAWPGTLLEMGNPQPVWATSQSGISS